MKGKQRVYCFPICYDLIETTSIDFSPIAFQSMVIYTLWVYFWSEFQSDAFSCVEIFSFQKLFTCSNETDTLCLQAFVVIRTLHWKVRHWIAKIRIGFGWGCVGLLHIRNEMGKLLFIWLFRWCWQPEIAQKWKIELENGNQTDICAENYLYDSYRAYNYLKWYGDSSHVLSRIWWVENTNHVNHLRDISMQRLIP